MLPKQQEILIIANSITNLGVKFNFHVGLVVSSKISFIFLLQLMARPVTADKCISIFYFGEIETWEVSMTYLFWMRRLMRGQTTAYKVVF